MHITKLGHCCLLIEVDGLRILTDPGLWSDGKEQLQNIDLILITHEHSDHLHMESVKKIMELNPKARIITNAAVGALLRPESLDHELLESGAQCMVNDVRIEGFGTDHAPIYPTIPAVENTGYRIAERLFYPGDAFTVIDKPVEILALPITAPWLTIAQAIQYAKAQQPQICFPVHDGFIGAPEFIHNIAERLLNSEGLRFVSLKAKESKEF